MLLLFEAVARVLATQLPPATGWRTRELQWQMARIAERSATEETRVVFVGSSAIGAALDPAVVTEYLGHDEWYGAWIASASAVILERWTTEVVVPTFQPEVVVIALAGFELNDLYNAASVREAYLDSPGRRRIIGEATLGDRLEETAGRVSALVALRPYLRSPAELYARLTGVIEPMAPPHGEIQDTRDWVYAQQPSEVEKVLDYVRDFAVGGRQLAALEATIAALEEQGVRVLLVDLPVLEEPWTAAHPRQEADLEEYRRLLERVAEAHEVPLLSFASVFQDERYFSDPIHLNGTGSERFSAALGERLVEEGATAEHR